MNFDKYTVKSQSALNQSFSYAEGQGNQSVETLHLLKALINEDEALSSFVFGKFGVNGNNIINIIDRSMESLPKVDGGERYFSKETTTALRKAESFASEFGDEYTSLEHLYL